MQPHELLPRLHKFLNTIKSLKNCVIKVDDVKIEISNVNGSKLKIRGDLHYMLYRSSCTEVIRQDLINSKIQERTAMRIGYFLDDLHSEFNNAQQTKRRYVNLEPIIKKARIGTTKYIKNK